MNVGELLRNTEGHMQFVDAVDRELLAKAAEQYSPAQEILIKAGGVGVGGVVGGGIGALAAITLIANPAFWAIAGATAVAEVVGGGITYYFADRHVDNYKLATREINTQMNELVNRTYRIILKFQKTKGLKIPYAKIKEHKKILIKQGYVGRWGSRSFSFNQKKFNEIKKYYPANEQAGIENTIKFVIMISAVIFPPKDIPTDSLINLSNIVDTLSNKALANYGRVILSRAYLNKYDKSKALEQLRKVPASSDLYKSVQKMIRDIQG